MRIPGLDETERRGILLRDSTIRACRFACALGANGPGYVKVYDFDYFID